MPSQCCVSGCKSNYKSEKTRGKHYVSVFLFPKNEELRKKWLSAIPRKNWTPSQSSVVCVLHFVEIDIIRYDTFPLPDGSIGKKLLRAPQLVKTAVPSIFPILQNYVSKPFKAFREDLSVPTVHVSMLFFHMYLCCI